MAMAAIAPRGPARLALTVPQAQSFAAWPVPWPKYCNHSWLGGLSSWAAVHIKAGSKSLQCRMMAYHANVKTSNFKDCILNRWTLLLSKLG